MCNNGFNGNWWIIIVILLLGCGGLRRLAAACGGGYLVLHLVPQLCLQFGQLFPTERIEHLIVKRTEEHTTMLEFICVRNFSIVGRDNISKNIEPHGKTKKFAFDVKKLFGHAPNLDIAVSKPL